MFVVIGGGWGGDMVSYFVPNLSDLRARAEQAQLSDLGTRAHLMVVP
jgi:hypothetical protein